MERTVVLDVAGPVGKQVHTHAGRGRSARERFHLFDFAAKALTHDVIGDILERGSVHLVQVRQVFKSPDTGKASFEHRRVPIVEPVARLRPAYETFLQLYLVRPPLPDKAEQITGTRGLSHSGSAGRLPPRPARSRGSPTLRLLR